MKGSIGKMEALVGIGVFLVGWIVVLVMIIHDLVTMAIEHIRKRFYDQND
jgi:hypothetical protein